MATPGGPKIPPPPPPPRWTRLLPPLRLPLHILLWTPALIFVTDHVLSLAWVRGRSMSPTLSPHHTHPATNRDCVLTWKWRVREHNPPLRRGEVIVFRLPSNPEKGVVKRVVGVEGDLVKLRRNARVLGGLDRDWMGGSGFVGAVGGVVEVPKGHLWVEGDEGFHSRDSNDYGPIPKGLVTARVKYIVWPLGRVGRVDDTPIEARGGRRAVVMKAEERGWDGEGGVVVF
ncbi:peptidase S24/S26A/S26B/S26C [Tirmania nivea]|nr:peptidase S24/S26A/S26B/S26C [Tirmania nivea]